LKTELVVTDLTRMSKDRVCIATVNKQCKSIRPKLVNSNFRLYWCYREDHIIQPFTHLCLDLLEPISNPPHTEDWTIDPNFIEIYKIIPEENRKRLLDQIIDKNVSCIFGAEIHHIENKGYFIDSGCGSRSLGTIKVKNAYHFSHRNYGHWDYRITFEDHNSLCYRLKIVDFSFQTYIDYLRVSERKSIDYIEQYINDIFSTRDLYFRVGLSRGWSIHPERCYLQINSIFTCPDYLNKKCFDDYLKEISKSPNEHTICEDICIPF